MDRSYTRGSQKHFHCATIPSYDRVTSILYVDTNFFKTQLHKGILTRPGITGSVTLFTPEKIGQHLLFARHLVEEVVIEDINEKEDRRVLTWVNEKNRDTEFFDNTTNAMAGLFKLGCELRSRNKKRGTYSIQDYIDGQKEQ